MIRQHFTLFLSSLFLCAESLLSDSGVTLENFEAPAYLSGSSIGNSTGWSVRSGAASVDTAPAHSGTQSVTLSAHDPETEISRNLALSDSEISFTDFWFKPVAAPTDSARNTIDLDRSLLAFVKEDSSGEVWVFDGDGQSGDGTWVATLFSYGLDSSDRAAEWIRLTFRQDFGDDLWDLYLNGHFYAIDLGFETDVPEPSSFVLFGNDGAASYLDDFQMGGDNPLFADDDRDGMPNDYEDARGLNKTVNDRDGDLDGDGRRNIYEYLVGTLPDLDESTYPGGLYFVNNLTGHGADTHDGRAVYYDGYSGPKESLQGGIDAAASGNTIILLPGDTIYTEGDLDLKGKDIILKPIGDVTIR